MKYDKTENGRVRCHRCGKRVPKSAAWDFSLSRIWQKGIVVYELVNRLCPKCGYDCRELIGLFLKSEPDSRRKMSAKQTQLTVNTLIIERAMYKRRLEKQQLAKLCGTTPSAISRLLNGTHKNMVLILTVCKELKLDYEHVVTAKADTRTPKNANERKREAVKTNAI